MDSNTKTNDFLRLFSLHSPRVYAYIHILVPNHADAEDLFQETSQTLWEKFDQYRPGPDEDFRAWALRIAQLNVLHYRQRNARRRGLFSEHVYNSMSKAGLRAIGSAEARFESLDDCYQKLPEDQRQIITARYQVGATIETIAAQTGRSVHSVYRDLRRIHQWLFDCIQGLERPETQPLRVEEDRES
jgi:RNA polymerase sigma-70 factor (ECF subfamily)